MPAPIGNRPPSVPVTGSTTAPSTPTTVTTSGASTTAVADPAGWVSGGTKPRPPTVDPLSLLTDAAGAPGASAFELVPGRYPDAVSLNVVLTQAASTPEGKAAFGQVLDAVQAKTGVPISPELRAAVLADPTQLTRALELTPAELAQGIQGLNAAYQAGKVPPVKAGENLLPQQFDLGTIGALDAPRPVPELKQLAPGLFTGDLPSTLPDNQLKQNRVLAEVFTRLSKNASAPEGQAFTASYNGQTVSTVDDLLGALKKDGYQVDVRFDSRVANFTNLKTVVPGSNPPKYLDVPAPLMMRTGVRDAQGTEALLPAVHSEMIVSIKSGAYTKGPKLDGDIKFYQGVSSTGFFPVGGAADPAWCGHTTTGVLSGEKASRAVSMAGSYTNLIDEVATKANLYAEGYGITGVCNDSVAVIEKALAGRATQYPLMMNDSVLMGAVKAHLSDANHADDLNFKGILSAIEKLPSDVEKSPSLISRALTSIPWLAEKEPFLSTVAARKILMAAARHL